MQRRLRRAAMEAGATLIAPETVFFCADTRLGRDVVDRAERRLRPRRDRRRRRAHPRLLASRRRRHRRRLRSSALSRGCVPARCSTRKSRSAISSRSRPPGSAPAPRPSTSPISATARSGAGANIGAGTITCNYDGVDKHRTTIGERRVYRLQHRAGGAGHGRRGAIVAAGSVVTRDVAADALTLGARPAGRQARPRGRDPRPAAGGTN